MSDEVDTTTISISTDDETTDEVTLPSGLIDLVAEGDQTDAETIGDITLLSFASRAHHIVHHGQGADEELEAQEARVMDLFEERFGVTYGEATGHQH
ncbi:MULTISPECIES: DUF7545 family protein [Natronorubrum]|uniref:Uncharacterized protein n=2 Tax=Natronorubrum bangense TaxID=61858 RepID=L9WR90_9EURY|nr:hypothetical protein [Natronorubrum bangense]ELY51932.1 hypothetical protein C494_02326 [Natronorubrum bangense JCM 10635]QCC55911.1 hypothetical protein DV706_10435 [Natronorubrum bangense]